MTSDLLTKQQGEVIKVGFLKKKGHVRRNWLDRWFVLTTEGLYYYKNRVVSSHSMWGRLYLAFCYVLVERLRYSIC